MQRSIRIGRSRVDFRRVRRGLRCFRRVRRRRRRNGRLMINLKEKIGLNFMI